jgi:Chaperone of endosialidase
MSISLVYYSNTFSDWVTTTNALVNKVVTIDTGDYAKTSGTFSVSVPSAFSSTLDISGRTTFTTNTSFTTGTILFSNTANVVFSVNAFSSREFVSNNVVKFNNVYANGNVWFSNTSTVHFAPNTVLNISSITLISNLNSELLGGNNSAYYISLSNTGITQAQASFGQANLAFSQANTGVIQAQAAFAAANNEPIAKSAFGQANLAFSQANTGVIQAQAAFAAANNEPIAKSAFGQANLAFSQANTGVIQAQAAFAAANNEPIAKSAFGQANTGVIQAQAAFAAANNEPIAKSAFGQANTGVVQAQAAFAKANTTNLQLNSLGVGTAASGTAGEIRATNDITAYYSDERLKNKLGNIEDALNKICSLDGFYYEANEVAQELGYKPKREVGVSAQQVQKVLPEIVVPAPIDDKYLTVRYEKLIPLLIEAIKEIDKKIKNI